MLCGCIWFRVYVSCFSFPNRKKEETGSVKEARHANTSSKNISLRYRNEEAKLKDFGNLGASGRDEGSEGRIGKGIQGNQETKDSYFL